MKITLLTIGKTDNSHLNTLIEEYLSRLKHYITFEIKIIPDIKNRKTLKVNQQKELEGLVLLKCIEKTDFVILLDENGKMANSVQFSSFLQKKMNSGIKQLVFVVGGPYGFSDAIYERAQAKIALSAMTFSHQMVRLIFVEQLYRAFSILNNEPYHHQ